MNCKICYTNETGSTSGICYKCHSDFPEGLSRDYFIGTVAKMLLDAEATNKIKSSDPEIPPFARILLRLRGEEW